MVTISAADVLGLTTRFRVVVDGVDLGGWARCQGIQVEFATTTINEGGNYDYQPILQDKIQYKPVVLERAMSAAGSAIVQNWLREKAATWMNGMESGGGGTAKITLFDSKAREVASWSLRNVYPSKWEGPDLTTATFGIAVEKLSLVHEGFL